MALAIMRRARYDETEATSALTILQSAQSPKHEIGAELFLPFHSATQPFQDYWLNDRLTVYSKKYMSTFFVFHRLGGKSPEYCNAEKNSEHNTRH